MDTAAASKFALGDPLLDTKRFELVRNRREVSVELIECRGGGRTFLVRASLQLRYDVLKRLGHPST
jgi:hypothetical protein